MAKFCSVLLYFGIAFADLLVLPGQEIGLIHDDWNHDSEGFFEEVHAHLERIPRVVEGSETRMLVIRTANRTLYARIEPTVDLSGPNLEWSNLEPSCLYRGHLVKGSEGNVALSICSGEDQMSGLLLTSDGPMVLRPIDDVTPELRHKRAEYDDAHLLGLLSTTHQGTCGTRTAPEEIRSEISELTDDDQVTSSDKIIVELAMFFCKFTFRWYRDKYGDKARHLLEQFAMAIINEVQTIYDHDSLKLNVRFNVVFIEPLTSSDTGLVYSDDAHEMLRSFCHFQQNMQAADNGKSGHWDQAVLFTTSHFTKNTLGLAWKSGICKSSYRCGITVMNKASRTSLITAHELGHSMGVSHDDKGPYPCEKKRIMASDISKGGFTWSSCSKTQMKSFFESAAARCLKNEPRGS